MYRMKLLVLAAGAVTSAAIFAQAPTVTVFEGARVIIGDGRAPIENAAFIVSGYRFIQVVRAVHRPLTRRPVGFENRDGLLFHRMPEHREPEDEPSFFVGDPDSAEIDAVRSLISPMIFASSLNDGDVVSFELFIMGDNRNSLDLRLRDEKAVKRIGMMVWKLGDAQSVAMLHS